MQTRGKSENFPKKERIRWHPNYSLNCHQRPYKAGWKLPRVLPLEFLAAVKLRFTFASSQSKSKSPSRSPRAKTHDFEMAPKKNKSKVEERTVANMSTGWRKSKMFESLVRELENMGLLQEQGVSQWRTGEEEDYPMEGTLETVMFRDFVERGLTLPVSDFFIVCFSSGEFNYTISLTNPSCIFQFSLISVRHSLEFSPISTFFNISSSLFQSLMPPIPPSWGDVNWYSALRTEASTWLMIRRVKESNGRSSGSILGTSNPHF